MNVQSLAPLLRPKGAGGSLIGLENLRCESPNYLKILRQPVPCFFWEIGQNRSRQVGAGYCQEFLKVAVRALN